MPQQEPGVPLHHVEILPRPRRQRTRRAQALQRPQDQGQGRAQLVAHHGEELRLELIHLLQPRGQRRKLGVGALQVLIALFQCLLGLLALSDVRGHRDHTGDLALLIVDGCPARLQHDIPHGTERGVLLASEGTVALSYQFGHVIVHVTEGPPHHRVGGVAERRQAAALGQRDDAGGIQREEDDGRVGDDHAEVLLALGEGLLLGGEAAVDKGHAEREAEDQQSDEGDGPATQR